MSNCLADQADRFGALLADFLRRGGISQLAAGALAIHNVKPSSFAPVVSPEGLLLRAREWPDRPQVLALRPKCQDTQGGLLIQGRLFWPMLES